MVLYGPIPKTAQEPPPFRFPSKLTSFHRKILTDLNLFDTGLLL